MSFEVKNYPEFSWSNSRNDLFEKCQTAYYYNYYAKHNGWNKWGKVPLIHPEANLIYSLSKLENLQSITGSIVHEEIAKNIKRFLNGGKLIERESLISTMNEQFSKVLKETLKISAWQQNLKSRVMLHEIYYLKDFPEFRQEANETAKIKKASFLDIVDGFLYSKTIKELSGNDVNVIEIDESRLKTGDKNHIFYNGVKIYATLDLFYQIEDIYYIVDWKTGKPSSSYDEQLFLYALYVQQKYGIPLDKLKVRLEYLLTSDMEEYSVDSLKFDEFLSNMQHSIQKMDNLKEHPDTNEPKKMEEFSSNPSKFICKMCPFREVCKDKFIETN